MRGEDTAAGVRSRDAEEHRCQPASSHRQEDQGRPSQPITQALLQCRQGDQSAFPKLMELLYDELRRLAHRQLRRDRPGQTLNTTGLVHEAYLKLVDHTQIAWQDRAHFFAVTARAMRQIIVDHARKRATTRHGGDMLRVELDRTAVGVTHQAEMLLALDEALHRLAAVDTRLIQVVECRFFAGYSERETAAALNTSLRTVQRDWKRAKAWLREVMERPPAPASAPDQE
jgi:RNA polymerase sigma factor (TIGR02999 family)